MSLNLNEEYAINKITLYEGILFKDGSLQNTPTPNESSL